MAIRKVFPGGNTAYGFYSFYDHIIGSEAARVFIIKGGPGVGKSTFMRRIGEEMASLGFDVELHCCSSDNTSLDGVVISDIGVAIIDGTAPHVIDPRWPGAIDEIINMGDYWKEAAMRANRGRIVALSREVSQLFAHAYTCLAQAKLLSDEIESYYEDAVDVTGLNRLKRDVVELVLGNKFRENQPSSRHLFASAITPGGCVNHFPTVFDAMSMRVIIQGGTKAARAALVEKVYQEALDRGYFVEAFHCGLIPDYLEHVVLTQLSIAVITTNEYHAYTGRSGDTLLDLGGLVNSRVLNRHRADLDRAGSSFHAALNRAIDFLRRAKTTHDELESYYAPNMDFGKIDNLYNKTLNRILGYAQEANKP